MFCLTFLSCSRRNRRLQKRSVQLSVPNILHNLGTCYLLSGNPKKALVYFEEELNSITTKMGGYDTLNGAFCYLNIAGAFAAFGNYAAAKKAAYEGATVFCRVLGKSDEHISGIISFCLDLSKVEDQ